jgi:tetrapyrrole methylase family protein/MazG family protein
MAIKIVGLGPSDGRYITREAWDILTAAEVVYLRTAHHPTIDDLPAHVKLISFDHLYENASRFSDVYIQMADQVVRLAQEALPESGDIVFAVPGHPLIGETVVLKILAKAEKLNLQVDITAGLSFVEPTLTSLGIDGLDGLQLFDALEIAGYNHPPLNTDTALLIGQVYNRQVANELKLALMALYPDEHEVVLIHSAGNESQMMEFIPLHSIDHSQHINHLSSLFVSPLPYLSSLPALAETIAYLRGPNGCPWDQEQTRQSMRSGFLEEAAEVLTAIDQDNEDAICEELGDLMYHIVMQAQLASEMDQFSLTDVVAGIEGKLRRRHPHVWGDENVNDSADVIRNWEELKTNEKEESGEFVSILDNIPNPLPALARSRKIQQRVAKVGFDWPSEDGVLDKLAEEVSELKSAVTPGHKHAEMGDILFSLVNWARWHNIDAEIALRDANIRFERRFRYMETMAREQALTIESLELDALDKLWEAAKLEVDTGSTLIN